MSRRTVHRPGARVLIGCAMLALAVMSAGRVRVSAQGRGGGPAAPPVTPRSQAPIDLTGYWVSVVNEDWLWRMVTPPKGDYASVPLNADGKRVADQWDTSRDGQCEAYGAAGLMRMPTRVHITWDGDSVLTVEADAGQQTRRLLFNPSQPPPPQHTLQGFSVAEWERGSRGGPQTDPAPGADLRVLTMNLRAGWLRKNGVPYSENATVTEYWDRFTAPDGNQWFSVTTIVSDPTYLDQDFVTSSHFRKEADGAKWSPYRCKAT